MTPDREFGFDTRALHAGQRPDPYTGARAVPIFQTTSYVFEDVASAAAYFNLQEYGNTYSRIMNPTVAVLEERIASLEGGSGAVAFASGLAAQAAVFFTLLQPGDHVLASRALYGGSLTQLKHLFRKLSVDLDLVDPADLGAWRRAAAAADQGALRRDDRQPGGDRARSRGRLGDRPRARCAADRRQHVRDALPLPAARLRRGHRGALGDEVPRRPRHVHRRSRRRLGTLRLVERPLPGRRRALPGLPRTRVPRDLRRVRLPDEAARGDAPRSRRRAEPVQRVPLPAGHRDARACACSVTSRTRSASPTSWRGVPRSQPCGIRRASRSRRGTSRAAPAPCSRSTSRTAARRARASSTRSPCGAISRTSATRAAS